MIATTAATADAANATEADAAAATAIRNIDGADVLGGLSISVLRMTIVDCRSSTGRCRRGGLPRLGRHVFFLYFHHPNNSREVQTSRTSYPNLQE